MCRSLIVWPILFTYLDCPHRNAAPGQVYVALTGIRHKNVFHLHRVQDLFMGEKLPLLRTFRTMPASPPFVPRRRTIHSLAEGSSRQGQYHYQSPSLLDSSFFFSDNKNARYKRQSQWDTREKLSSGFAILFWPFATLNRFKFR